MKESKKVNLDLTEQEIQDLGQYGTIKGPFLRKIMPKSWWRKYNEFLLKHDDTIEKVDNFITNTFYKPFWPIRWWYRDHVMGIFRHRIPQAWAYVKFAWYDYDWDHSYFLRLLIFKLKRMEKDLRNDSQHYHSEIYADQVKLCLECLERYYKDEYFLLAKKELETLFPKEAEKEKSRDWIKGKEKKSWIDNNGNKVTIYECKTRERSEEYYQKYKELNFYYDKVKSSDLRVAFHIMTPGILPCKYSDWEKFLEKCREAYREEEEVFPYHNGLNSWWS